MLLEDIEKYKHFDKSEQLVKILKGTNKTADDNFFRILSAYYFAKLATIMRTEIVTPDRGILPPNLFCLSLATSGFGKGRSINIMEEQIINGFRDKFIADTLPIIGNANIEKIAMHKHSKTPGSDLDEIKGRLEREYKSTGSFLFSFDSGTPAAIKQFRHQLILAGIGSINLEMDEVGANLSSNLDLLNTFIELYDVGKIKPKLVKNTAENRRNEDIEGRTPTNMLLFGTPSKLLDGSKSEDDFFSMLDMGYARRLLFSYVPKPPKVEIQDATTLYATMTDSRMALAITTLNAHATSLAEVSNYNKQIMVPKDVAIELINYQTLCDIRANELKDHEDLARAELTHRYFKTIKLAGCYAFFDKSTEVTLEHLQSAIKLVEESGTALQQMMKREKPYVKLAKYIADVDADLTQVDLVESLPFYKGSESQKRELLNLAIAYGYKNNMIIKKSYVDNIEFLRGESLKETNTQEMIISYSKELAANYFADKVPFSQLDKLFTTGDFNFTNHHFTDGHRTGTKLLPGFNMIVLDVDEGISVATAKEVFQDYSYWIYTTKRHTATDNRFRIVLPISHILNLNTEDFSRFMTNIYDWLPFTPDTSAKDGTRKWATHKGSEIHYNEGKLFDVMDYIPETKKCEDMQSQRQTISSMSNLEAWLFRTMGEGNRNNLLLKYALALVDNGYDYSSVVNAVLAFNSKLSKPLPELEIHSTIMITVAKKYTK